MALTGRLAVCILVYNSHLDPRNCRVDPVTGPRDIATSNSIPRKSPYVALTGRLCVPVWTRHIDKKEWISLFLEWIFEIRVNLVNICVNHFGVTSGITRNPWVIPVVTPKWKKNVHCNKNFLKSEHKTTMIFGVEISQIEKHFFF